MNRLLRFASLTALMLAFVQPVSAAKAPAVAAAETSDGQLAGTVIVPDGLKAAEVQRSILEAATNRGWTIKSKDDGKISIFLENGRWIALLHLVYDTKEVQIHSKSTRNGKAALPEDWIKYIKQDLTKSMNAKAFLK
jgi:hypothetical protein